MTNDKNLKKMAGQKKNWIEKIHVKIKTNTGLISHGRKEKSDQYILLESLELSFEKIVIQMF